MLVWTCPDKTSLKNVRRVHSVSKCIESRQVARQNNIKERVTNNKQQRRSVADITGQVQLIWHPSAKYYAICEVGIHKQQNIKCQKSDLWSINTNHGTSGRTGAMILKKKQIHRSVSFHKFIAGFFCQLSHIWDNSYDVTTTSNGCPRQHYAGTETRLSCIIIHSSFIPGRRQ